MKQTVKDFSLTTVLIIVSVVMLVMCGLGTWAFQVATSDIKGQGDSIRTKNSAPNRIAKQEEFEDLYADIVASDKKLDQLAKDKKDGTRETATRYSGVVSHCQTVTGQYNALARKYTAEDFRAVDLPEQIDETDPATDCKEN